MTSSLKSSVELNVFAGLTALLDFLDPGKHPPTPLVELPEELNPFASKRVRVFVKLLFLTPLFNAKLLASRNLFEEAHASGRLKRVHTLVENSSGNKILADALLARLFGIENVVAIVPPDIPPKKQALLELFGAECRKELDGIAKARELGAQPGWWNPAQYHDEGNPRGSERWLAPQLWKQTRRTIRLFCAGIGTGGTIIGTSRWFRNQAPYVKTLGVVPAKEEVPGVRTLSRLEEIGLPWRTALNFDPIVVGTEDAYFQSLRLCSRGILAGPSSGMALYGLYRFLGSLDRMELDCSRNDDGEVVAVVACPDSCMLYLDKYSTRLSGKQMMRALE